ncbi:MULTISPECIES: Scr1 family TA system antitoxin-like transcriptional regulator [unclassified Streptomyces]|uniref:Scr1 family TA system antitoxin-like transcriptional regulator n=1 Tax=unclassified Streptomyces TaxID=2593676 RepID=UPI002E29DD9E|nr:Scr1 family TA system antitoxin-like transcriptional regulator [Streptomyces sp. NBC_00273]
MYVEWKRVFGNGLMPVQEAALPRYERTRHFRIYEPDVVPGLLQTPAYARALMGRVIAVWGIPDDAEQAAEVLAVRKAAVLRAPAASSASSWRRPRMHAWLNDPASPASLRTLTSSSNEIVSREGGVRRLPSGLTRPRTVADGLEPSSRSCGR